MGRRRKVRTICQLHTGLSGRPDRVFVPRRMRESTSQPQAVNSSLPEPEGMGRRGRRPITERRMRSSRVVFHPPRSITICASFSE